MQIVTQDLLENPDYTRLFEEEDATHVITEIQYGSDAYFIFEKEVKDDEKKTDVSGSLKVAVQKIPSFSISGEGSVKIDENTTEATQNLKVTFKGDYDVREPPATFEGAIKTFRELATRNDSAVPLMVKLTPLHKLNNDGQRLLRSISKDAIQQASKLQQEKIEIDEACNGLLGTITAERFPTFNNHVKRVKDSFTVAFNTLQGNLSKIIPQIRNGSQNDTSETDLFLLINKYDESEGSKSKFDEWFELIEPEAQFVQIFYSSLDSLQKTTLVTSSNVFSRELYNHARNHNKTFIMSTFLTSQVDMEFDGNESSFTNTSEKGSFASDFDVKSDIYDTINALNRISEWNSNLPPILVHLEYPGQKNHNSLKLMEGYQRTEDMEDLDLNSDLLDVELDGKPKVLNGTVIAMPSPASTTGRDKILCGVQWFKIPPEVEGPQELPADQLPIDGGRYKFQVRFCLQLGNRSRLNIKGPWISDPEDEGQFSQVVPAGMGPSIYDVHSEGEGS